MLGHNRPMHEVLAPQRKDIAAEFARGFEGMTDVPVAIAELLAARERIIAIMVGDMPDAHRRFLISFTRGEPDWSLLGLPEVANLPAVKWRRRNLDTLSPEARTAEVAKLEKVLFGAERNG